MELEKVHELLEVLQTVFGITTIEEVYELLEEINGSKEK